MQRHLEQVVPFMVKVFLKAWQEALGSLLKENLGTIATAPPGRVEETVEALPERVAGAKETTQQCVQDGKDNVQEHVTEGSTSASKDGAQEP
jgi:hypothetical protein